MRFASLGSGSRGNGTLVQAGATTLLVDCGFSVRETEQRLARRGLSAKDIDAILVTHEHSDHVGGVGALARRYNLSVWLTPGTLTAAGTALGELPSLSLFSSHEPFAVGDVAIEPVTVPHDAREPSQFVFGDGARRLGVLTDAGHVTAHMISMLDACDALMLEFNHDRALLLDGAYPQALKRRVGGRLGHLSNDEACGLLRRIDTRRLQHVVAAHLSEQNNTPAHVRQALALVLDCEPHWPAIADQDAGLGWRELS